MVEVASHPNTAPLRPETETPPCAPIQLWSVRLRQQGSITRRLEELLSESEQRRAQRFYSTAHRDRFICGRAAVRFLLSAIVDCDAADIQFATGPAGKPTLAFPANTTVEFNFSHCEEEGLLAISFGAPVGVDLEQIRALEEGPELVGQFFSSREARIYNSLAPHIQPQAFFNLWTRKEALLKATGDGIAHSLPLVEVSFLPGEPARIIALPENFGRTDTWKLCDVPAAPDFAAALAISAPAEMLSSITSSTDLLNPREFCFESVL